MAGALLTLIITAACVALPSASDLQNSALVTIESRLCPHNNPSHFQFQPPLPSSKPVSAYKYVVPTSQELVDTAVAKWRARGGVSNENLEAAIELAYELNSPNIRFLVIRIKSGQCDVGGPPFSPTDTPKWSIDRAKHFAFLCQRLARRRPDLSVEFVVSLGDCAATRARPSAVVNVSSAIAGTATGGSAEKKLCDMRYGGSAKPVFGSSAPPPAVFASVACLGSDDIPVPTYHYLGKETMTAFQRSRGHHQAAASGSRNSTRSSNTGRGSAPADSSSKARNQGTRPPPGFVGEGDDDDDDDGKGGGDGGGSGEGGGQQQQEQLRSVDYAKRWVVATGVLSRDASLPLNVHAEDRIPLMVFRGDMGHDVSPCKPTPKRPTPKPPRASRVSPASSSSSGGCGGAASVGRGGVGRHKRKATALQLALHTARSAAAAVAASDLKMSTTAGTVTTARAVKEVGGAGRGGGGSSSSSSRVQSSEMVCGRELLLRLGKQRPELIDASESKVDVPLRSMAAYRFAGVFGKGACGWSGRTKALLFMASALVMQESFCAEFFAPHLKPWVHYIPVDHSLSTLFGALEWANAHFNRVDLMASNARKFAEAHLSLRGVEVYLEKLLVAYADLRRRSHSSSSSSSATSPASSGTASSDSSNSGSSSSGESSSSSRGSSNTSGGGAAAGWRETLQPASRVIKALSATPSSPASSSSLAAAPPPPDACSHTKLPSALEVQRSRTHGDVCRFQDGSLNFECPLHCLRVPGEPYCEQEPFPFQLQLQLQRESAPRGGGGGGGGGSGKAEGTRGQPNKKGDKDDDDDDDDEGGERLPCRPAEFEAKKRHNAVILRARKREVVKKLREEREERAKEAALLSVAQGTTASSSSSSSISTSTSTSSSSAGTSTSSDRGVASTLAASVLTTPTAATTKTDSHHGVAPTAPFPARPEVALVASSSSSSSSSFSSSSLPPAPPPPPPPPPSSSSTLSASLSSSSTATSTTILVAASAASMPASGVDSGGAGGSEAASRLWDEGDKEEGDGWWACAFVGGTFESHANDPQSGDLCRFDEDDSSSGSSSSSRQSHSNTYDCPEGCSRTFLDEPPYCKMGTHQSATSSMSRERVEWPCRVEIEEEEP